MGAPAKAPSGGGGASPNIIQRSGLVFITSIFAFLMAYPPLAFIALPVIANTNKIIGK